MKGLTTEETWSLIRHHADALRDHGGLASVRIPTKAELVSHAERALQLLRSIPQSEFGAENYYSGGEAFLNVALPAKKRKKR